VVSFVAWFHRRPPRFTGGELVLHDTAARRYSRHLCTRFAPEAGTLVAFPSATFHSVRPVGGDITDLADARLAITGHIRAPVAP
jgi:Rps23 Pro-64 3,4-dihydroxylase Tpa1-like proline 4-hydroxylase